MAFSQTRASASAAADRSAAMASPLLRASTRRPRAAALLVAAAALLLAHAPAAQGFTPVSTGTYTVVCPGVANMAPPCQPGQTGTYTITVWQKATWSDMMPTINASTNAFWGSSPAETAEMTIFVYMNWDAQSGGAPTTNDPYDVLDGLVNETWTMSAIAPVSPLSSNGALGVFKTVNTDDDETRNTGREFDTTDATPLSFATATFVSDAGGNSGFNGEAYEFCGAALGPQCHGRAFNMLSEARHQFNAEVNRHHGTGDRDAFPAAGSWLTAFGLRFGPSFSVVLRMRTDVDYTLVQEGDKTRALHPSAGGAGALSELLQSVQVNGADAMAKVGSGETQEFEGGVSVHWPATRHAGDATDGPIAVITTPDTTWTWFIESEDTWHLDFKISLRSGARLDRMHGLLGQSMDWARGAPAVVEGGDDLQYVLADGLLGTAFKFNAFTGARRPATGTRAMLAVAGVARGAGTPAAVARG
ncbi:MAG: hypothetical protein J3K34DRAFT_472788 [Monoraphidium minutum]|nr:MAG: hypothetical protein J3K34DRAFT_472788 [Monoraphidium minutum]